VCLWKPERIDRDRHFVKRSHRKNFKKISRSNDDRGLRHFVSDCFSLEVSFFSSCRAANVL
jgi:hypothetical protein